MRAVARSGVRKKGVAGQQHQVEASIQPGRSGVIEHPGYARAPAPAFRQGEHRRGRIDAGERQSGFLDSAAASTPVAQPRSSIARRLRQITARFEILGPAILNVVKSKDRHNGRTRSFRRSNGRRNWPKSGIAFLWRTARKWATYKSSKMTARRSHPALSSQP